MSLQMRRLTCALVLTAASLPSLHAQTTPAFEVASIRPTPDTPPAAGVAGVHISQQQVRFSYLSLRDYISIAHKVSIQQISAPEWINSARFDIAATFPAGATREQFPQLVEALLRDRFRLRVHRESRESPIYALERLPGFRLTPVPEETLTEGPVAVTSSGSPDGVVADLGQGSSLLFTKDRFEVRKVTMAILTETLGRFLDRPVVNLTKLEGHYDLSFTIAPEEYMPMLVRSAVNAGIPLPPTALSALDGASIGSVIDGLKALGLSLEARRGPLDVLVVDSIERMPTEN